MSEGGMLAWKRQKLHLRPTADYDEIKKPIQLPQDKAWVKDQKGDWSVVDLVDKGVAVAIPVASQDSPSSDEKAISSDGVLNADIIITEEEIDLQKERNTEKKVPKAVQHIVQPTDTLQGLCLRYKISPVELRQFNRFSGNNLMLAPSTLIIPAEYYRDKNIPVPMPQVLTKDQLRSQLIHKFLAQFADKHDLDGSLIFGRQEAVAYLEINDWNLAVSIDDARSDFGWETDSISVSLGKSTDVEMKSLLK
ncbi:hypothetical protein CTEN210_08952 [Chaetoceros tenuissimus]|uniref:LysM domain-containing protein n=1 Tax=Chaetoceros tenuissimus TaxID=426638 RepID=A0AAD3CWJ1_9STRA|nr:hypothetical protein CTEN210_08952 [Chaetoceros tenuissimus]